MAYIAFLLVCAALEIFAPKGAGDLWIVVVLWTFFGTFTTKEKE